MYIYTIYIYKFCLYIDIKDILSQRIQKNSNIIFYYFKNKKI